MTTRPSAFPIRRPFLPLAIAVAPLVASSPAGANDFCFFATPYEVQNSPSCVVQADFNGDSRLDLVVANHEVGQDTISVLINNGGDISIHHGTFTGPGDAGGFGSGVLIDSFTRTAGPMPTPLRAAQDRRVGPTTK